MKREIRYEISTRIKKYRHDRGLTQAELAEKSSMKYKYIQQIEGKNPPNMRVDTLERIAKALQIKTSKLLDA